MSKQTRAVEEGSTTGGRFKEKVPDAELVHRKTLGNLQTLGLSGDQVGGAGHRGRREKAPGGGARVERSPPAMRGRVSYPFSSYDENSFDAPSRAPLGLPSHS